MSSRHEVPAGDTHVERKTFATVRAEAALAACTLHQLAGGGYVLGRWGKTTRELRDLEEVTALLKRMAGRHA